MARDATARLHADLGGRQVETEYLPPGHPITVDIEVDIDSLKQRLASGDLVVRDGKLHAGASQKGGHRHG